MRYRIKQLNNLTVNANTPGHALRKAVRKLVRNISNQGGNIYELVNERIDIIDENNTLSEYIVTIIKATEEKSIYYKLDYEIEIYKKLNNI